MYFVDEENPHRYRRSQTLKAASGSVTWKRLQHDGTYLVRVYNAGYETVLESNPITISYA